MELNALQRALVDSGLTEAPKPKRKKKNAGKPVICHKCGKPMDKIDNSNLAVCRNCEVSFIVFNR